MEHIPFKPHQFSRVSKWKRNGKGVDWYVTNDHATLSTISTIAKTIHHHRYICVVCITVTSYEYHGISKHQQLKCFSTASLSYHQRKHQSSVLLALCEGNPPVTGGFPSQRASNSEIISMSYSYHRQATYPPPPPADVLGSLTGCIFHDFSTGLHYPVNWKQLTAI